MRTCIVRRFWAASLLLASAAAQAFTCGDLDGAYLISQDATPKYLGFIGSRFASESVMNPYGTYGNRYGTNSVRNTYGSYGSPYSSLSANNSYAARPPVIARAGQFLGFLTSNSAAGVLGVRLTDIDASCTNLLSSAPASPVVPPSLPSYTPPAAVTVPLANGRPAGPVLGGAGSTFNFTFEVPAGVPRVIFLSALDSSGSGDADIFVRRGALPTGSIYDCASTTNNNSSEACVLDSPQAGTWYVTIYGYTSYSGLFLYAEYRMANLIGAHNSGIFWNADRSGEGMQVVYTQVGTTPLLGATFYTYDLDGNPLFLVGGAVIDRTKPGPHSISVASSRGARFGTAFNPEDVQRTTWGTLKLTYVDCDNVVVEYSSVITGYGTGVIPMNRAAPRAEGVACP